MLPMSETRAHRKLPLLVTERLILRLPDETEAQAMLRYFSENRGHLEPWDPQRHQEFYTEEFWHRQQRVSWEDFRAERAVRFVLFPESDPQRAIGTVSLSVIQRGPAQSCNLGYGLAASEQGKGLMHEALQAVIAYAFDELHLHRLSANYVPHNTRSGAVLHRLGFVVEGRARDYLLIAGRWQDHILTSLTNPDWTPP